MKAIINSVHKRALLSVVTDLYKDLQDLLQPWHRTFENFLGFELHFSAQSTNFYADESSASLPESRTPLMLLAIASVDAAQRISILPAPAPELSKVAEFARNDDFI